MEVFMNMIEGNKDEKWFIDDDLRKLAEKLIDKHDELGHIIPEKILFCSLVGGSSSQKWWGRCTKLAYQARLIPYFMLERFCQGDVEQIDSFDPDLLDIRYIITINRDLIQTQSSETEKTTEITMFHELKHIDPDMRKIVEHDIKDFKSVLDKYGVHWDSGHFKEDDGIEGSS